MTGFLFPQRILRVAYVTDCGRVMVPNASDAVYAIDAAGRRWVKKQLIGSNDLLAESIGWLLSGALRIPTPAAAVCGTGAEAAWLSEVIPDVGHWKPARAQVLRDPDHLGAMIALDAIIGNGDRHARNILVRPDENRDQLLVYSIDLGNAWLGTPSDIAGRGLEVPDVDQLADGISADLIRHGAEACATAAAKLDHRLIHEFVQEGCEIASVRDCTAIEEALRRRCLEGPRLVRQYLAKIEGRS